MPKYISTPEDVDRFFEIDPDFDPKWNKRNPREKKIVLLNMARNGEPRPALHSKDPIIRKLASNFGNYINPKSECYDEVFDKKIRKNGSHWFEDTVAINKAKLLEMARNGEPRPSKSSKDPILRKLGGNLSHYINPKSECYDEVFDKEIRMVGAYWFIDKVAINKAKLLEIARNGGSKPSRYSKDSIIKKLSSSFSRYTNPKSYCYDEVFDKEIRKLRPDWFENSAVINKEKLLEMARNGEPRPSKSSKDPILRKLSNNLSMYTNYKSECYDEVFDEEIRKLRPDWFLDTAAINKAKLLEMAKNGELRPSKRSKDPIIKILGSGLSNYINEKCNSYDKKFHKKIKEIGSHWFPDK